MTVGEKIQYYRKKNGLSQEELGQKMLVSRQTVSLWEMDKTLPTVDNLIRLKEFFSVSVDEILCETEPNTGEHLEPTETYVFKHEESDLKQIFKKERSRYVKRGIISALILFILFTKADDSGILRAMLLSWFFITVILSVRGFSYYRNTEKKTTARILQNTYSYEIFSDCFILHISRNDEITEMLKVYYDEIEEIQSCGNCFLINAGGQRYIIKKDVLDPQSPLLTLCKQFRDKARDKKPWDKFRKTSLILFLLSIGTIGAALFVVSILTASNKAMHENMWVFFLFVPIPIASILFGFYLKKKGYRYKKNIIVGFIMVGLLCIYGSFTFLFSNIYSHSDEPIRNVEQLLDIDIPPYSHVNTQDWTEGIQDLPRGYIYLTTDIYFDDADVKGFEDNLEADDKWISSIPASIVGITSYFCDILSCDYYIIYNMDTGEFNKLPEESGTYEFANVLYNAENNTMKLVVYLIEYTE